MTARLPNGKFAPAIPVTASPPPPPPPPEPPKEPANPAPTNGDAQPFRGDTIAPPDPIVAPYGVRKDGTPAAKRGAKPRHTRNPDPPGVTPGQVADQSQRFEAAARMIVDTVEGGAVSILGDEWKMRTEEKPAITGATAAYLRYKNFPDIPPGWLLLAVVCAYALPRVGLPGTQERIKQIRGQFSSAPA
jgi:hypothetical protein